MKDIENSPDFIDLRPPLRAAAQAAHDGMDAAAGGDEEAIHGVRRALKRLRALARLAEFGDATVEARQIRREAAALARRLSAARDWRAARDALEKLHTAKLISARQRNTLTARLRSAAAATASPTTGDPASINTESAALRARIDMLPATMTPSVLARGFAHTYRRARRAQPDSIQEADAAALHEWRKRVIDHRYQMALLAPLWPRYVKFWLAELQDLRTALGDHNDLCVLERSLAPTPGTPARRPAALNSAIAQRQRQLRTEAIMLARRIFAERPRTFRQRVAAILATPPPAAPAGAQDGDDDI